MKNNMRVALTKQMLQESVLRVLAYKTLSKITISDICKDAGINRATFYRHYEAPAMILKDIVKDYYTQLSKILHDSIDHQQKSRKEAVTACLEYIYFRKDEVKVLFSKNAENSISGYALSCMTESLKENKNDFPKISQGSEEDAFLCAVVISSAVYGLIDIWLTMDIDRSPEEMMDILIGTLNGRYFIAI